MNDEEIDATIIKLIGTDPGINQISIIGAFNRKVQAPSKNTIIKHIKELEGNKKINCHKHTKDVTYTLIDLESEKDVEKILYFYLDGLTRLIKKTKCELPQYHYDAKCGMNQIFKELLHQIEDGVSYTVKSSKDLRNSKASKIKVNWSDTYQALKSLQNEKNISDEHYRILQSGAWNIRVKLLKLDEQKVQTLRKLDKTKNKKARNALDEELHILDNEIVLLYTDLEEIDKKIRQTPGNLENVVKKINKIYVERKADIADNISRLLREYGESLYQEELSRIVSKIIRDIESLEDERSELYDNLNSSTNQEDIKFIRHRRKGKDNKIKAFNAKLKEINDRLELKEPLPDIAEPLIEWQSNYSANSKQ